MKGVWHPRIPLPSDDRETITHRFVATDALTKDTPARIEATLVMWRALRNHRPSAPIGMLVARGDIDEPTFQSRRKILGKAMEGFPAVVVTRTATSKAPQITVTLDHGKVTMAFGTLLALSADVDETDTEGFLATFLYCVCALCLRAGLLAQAMLLARRALDSSVRCPSRELAFMASTSLATDIRSATKLAILNGLHEGEDGIAEIYLAQLLVWAAEPSERGDAYEQFALRVLAAGDRSTVRYGLGNYYASRRRWLDALHQFNLARKTQPQYLQLDYFQREVGGVLFSSGRYSEAAKWYRLAESTDKSQLHEIRLGDALLLSGKAADAAMAYGKANSGPDRSLTVQAEVKRLLADDLVSRIGASLPTKTSLAKALFDSSETETVLSADALHYAANFNRGMELAREGDYARAISHFLVCAVARNGDSEAWTNALTCSTHLDAEWLPAAIMECALTLGGEDALEEFRTHLASHVSAEVVAAFDAASYEIGRPARPDGVTLRVHTGPGQYTEYQSG